jgi:hypothetical protein
MLENKFNLIVALYALCSDYHSGQWSRGYRILSRITSCYKPENIPCTKEELVTEHWDEALLIYEKLEGCYASKL